VQERLGIAGAGAIACGLAATAARTGEVVLWARSEGSARRARARVEKTCARLDDGTGTVDPERVHVVTDLAALAAGTFLVEAVVEDHAHKAALLRDLARHAAPEAVLATTTSSLSIADLALAAGRPESFVGLHVFNPVPRMKLIELVFPEAATADTRARAQALCEALEKTAVEVPDIPGFVVNRLLFPYLFDAVRLLERTGMPAADIDECMRLGAGHPMGPLALLDLVGLDVSLAIGEAIEVDVPQRLADLVADGALGRKTRRGFHAYE